MFPNPNIPHKQDEEYDPFPEHMEEAQNIAPKKNNEKQQEAPARTENMPDFLAPRMKV